MCKILYVDDEIINLELFKINFNDVYDVSIASSAFEGLDILKEKDFSVVVSDLKMPGMNGIEFISEIRKHYSQTVCILLTAFMETDVMLEAINEKTVFKYLLKPWKKEVVKKTIDAAIEQYKQNGKHSA